MLQTVSGQILVDKFKDYEMDLIYDSHTEELEIHYGGVCIFNTNDFILLEQMFCEEEGILAKFDRFGEMTMREWLINKGI